MAEQEHEMMEQPPDDNIPLVYAEFTDAYSFRNLIEYLTLTNDNGNFIFYPKTIEFSRQSDSKHVLNDLVIYTHELTRYDYNAEEEQVVLGINLQQFKGATKKIGKKDIARLSVFSSGICLQIVGSPKSCSGGDLELMRTQRINHPIFKMGDRYQSEDEPNCVVSIQMFTSACGELTTCKDNLILVVGLGDGLILESRQGGNLRASIKCLGQALDQSTSRSSGFSEKITRGGENKNIRLIVKRPNEIVRHRIPRRIIVALGKLTNISPNGTVKIYIQPKLPIKLSFHLSTYGKLDVFLWGGGDNTRTEGKDDE